MVVTDPPIFGVCGWRGSGKTALTERLLPRLRSRRLRVAVIKHRSFGIQLDRWGKDSERFFRSAADVYLPGSGKEVPQARPHQKRSLVDLLKSLPQCYDLVIVEGYKETTLPKVWLLNPSKDPPPPSTQEIVTTLLPGSNWTETILTFIGEWLPGQWLKTSVLGCVLIGGRSTRMGQPKHLIEENGKTWLQRILEVIQQVSAGVVIVGRGTVPKELEGFIRLPDVPDSKGPLAGILAAMRWAPSVSWLVVACDLADLSSAALRWLLSTRRPGVWATLPRLQGNTHVEPLLAHYDFRARSLLETLAARKRLSLSELAASSKVITPSPPSSLAPAWKNLNTPIDRA